jgi:hypothetical protein
MRMFKKTASWTLFLKPAQPRTWSGVEWSGVEWSGVWVCNGGKVPKVKITLHKTQQQKQKPQNKCA